VTVNAAAIPLAAYVHLPWCIRKCPYCDFNSHAAHGAPPFDAYTDAVARDIAWAAARLSPSPSRPLQSVFFGGGTPSLFAPRQIEKILHALDKNFSFAADVEITVEANPGAAERKSFRGYRAAGVNRLSIGAQSFSDRSLRAIGRVHNAADAVRAVAAAHGAGFTNVNVDLMFALPGQGAAAAAADVAQAVALSPAHLSVYQLTIEPNTVFHRRPPPLPDQDAAAAMWQRIAEQLDAAGHRRYEVSAHARDGFRCRHNLNYWRFGDYLGFGAGAHAKLSGGGGIIREHRVRNPRRYMECAGGEGAIAGRRLLRGGELPLEFLMNALRLVDGFHPALFTERTGLRRRRLQSAINAPRPAALLAQTANNIKTTARGFAMLDHLLAEFTPPPAHATMTG